ncbi:MAG: hypothetical protein IJJ23_04800 [Clostridia bacterium]|nr:hypothetical protein [Clostridia bacterium]
MKKTLLALALVLVLAFSAAALGESDYTYFPESENYLGEWISGDYFLSVGHSDKDVNLFVCAVTHLTDTGSEAWYYDGMSYDDITAGLSCEKIGVKTVFTEGVDDYKTEFDDGAAVFAMDEDGNLVWTDFYTDPDTEPVVFEPYGLFVANLIADAYEGDWVCEGVSLKIESLDDVVYVTVTKPDDNGGASVWEYAGVEYDWVSKELNTVETGVKTNVVYAEDGEKTDEQVEYSDGAASFALDGEGGLVWTDYKTGEQITFERA